jgi:hypothetical protein
MIGRSTNLSMPLLGETVEKKAGANDALLKWYCARLEAAFGHVAQPRLVKNSRAGTCTI